MLGIAVNRCRTWIGRRRRVPEPVDYLQDVPGRPPEKPADELTAAIRTAVDDLRAEYREVFVLFHEQGRAYEEIAAAVGRPVGTVKTWLHRGRGHVLAALRRRGLGPDAPEEKTAGEPSPATRP